MKRIAVIGASGFVGKQLHQSLLKNRLFDVTAVTRINYPQKKKNRYDIVINAAMPSARFWALKNPSDDFSETVQKTADIFYGWNFKKFVQISTLSARTELDTVYGRHKRAAEILCQNGDTLIVRLSAMYDDTLKKGALIDMINGKKVYVSKKSRYCFASLEFVCDWIAGSLDKTDIVEVGAKNSVSLEAIAKHFSFSTEFEGRLDIQEVQNPSSDFPDAKQVFTFLEKQLQQCRTL